jgi:tRNA A-37 threonylcarbamoyl transferase component Bud32
VKNLPCQIGEDTLLQPGDILRQRYKIQTALSRGGMGAVYLAEDMNLANSLCAVKQMLDLGAEMDEYVKSRFAAEMQVLSRLRHPGIPNVRDFFQDERGWFLVMDYIQGQTLEQELEAHRQAGTHFSGPEAVADMLVVLGVLRYLHEQEPQLLHRDIKPANLIRDQKSGQLVVVDFGLARSLEQEASALHTSVGTLGYSAHEQLMGKPEVASDLYSVGATLTEMVSGLRPTLVGVEKLTVKNMPDYEPRLAALLARACDHEPRKRFASAREMAEALRPARSSSTSPEVAARKPKPGRGLALLFLGLLAVGGGLLVSRGTSAPVTPGKDPGVQGDLFVGRHEDKLGVVGLGEDIGLFWIEEKDAASARKRAQVVAGRLNYLYHHQCLQCGAWLLEPAGVRVGRYQRGSTDEVVVFYAHLHGEQFAYGPELLVTIEPSLARRVKATPRYAAGYWRDLLRDVVTVSRGEASARTALGPSFQPVVQQAQQQPPATLERLRQALAGLSSKQANGLREAFRQVPEEVRIEPDQFPEHNGFKPLAN